MTTFTNDDIAEFKAICEEEGDTLTMEEAEEGARRLLQVYEILLTPTPRELRTREVLCLLEDPLSHAEIRILKRGSRRG